MCQGFFLESLFFCFFFFSLQLQGRLRMGSLFTNEVYQSVFGSQIYRTSYDISPEVPFHIEKGAVLFYFHFVLFYFWEIDFEVRKSVEVIASRHFLLRFYLSIIVTPKKAKVSQWKGKKIWKGTFHEGPTKSHANNRVSFLRATILQVIQLWQQMKLWWRRQHTFWRIHFKFSSQKSGAKLFYLLHQA